MSPKTFIITGASKGLGAAIAQSLLSQSHNVVLTARSQGPMDAMKQANAGRVEVLAGDITDPGIPKKLVDLAVKTFGGLDGMVLNHGVLHIKGVQDLSIEEMKRDYDINVFSCLAMTHAGLDEIRKSKGCVLFTSTGAAMGAVKGWASYGSSKAALHSIAAHLAKDVPEITSVSIAPGKVDTGMQTLLRSEGQKYMDPRVHESFIDEHESGRLLKPEQPGRVMAKFVANPKKELSGKYCYWNAAELAEYQE